MIVTIDGVVYRPETEAEAALAEDARTLLSQVYGTLWAEAYYDGGSDELMKFAQPLADKMSALNDILKFKK